MSNQKMGTRRQHRRLDKIEARTTVDEEDSPWIVFGPQWAEKENVPDSPDELEAPVYSEEYGWMESDKALPSAFIWIRGPQDPHEGIETS